MGAKSRKMNNRFKPKFNIKKGDNVVVIAGDDKDIKKPRTVLAVYPDKAKVLVEGVNVQTKHTKPTAQNTKGGIVKKEAPLPFRMCSYGMPKPARLHVSNAARQW
jgi:large subunit ribosomal protein L24